MSNLADRPAGTRPTPLPRSRIAIESDRLPRRRLFVLALNAATIAAFLVAMISLMRPGGIALAEAVTIGLFGLTLPWLSIGFWNAVIGFVILKRERYPAAAVNPFVRRAALSKPVTARTAIVMAVRNEDPREALARLEAIAGDLGATPFAALFDIHVLSDTSDPDIARAEEHLFNAWVERSPACDRLFYRRRTDNVGFKAGNIAEFVERCHRDYDFFLPLDADSAMSGRAILKLVRIMQASPELGLLQGLVVGSPATSTFTRAFQFGMRQGMRTYTLGSAWWQGDCGPFWGHNALIRIEPFHRHCQLPVLSGSGPLSGHIMSHDQVEAVLLRRAGYQCRVLAEEDESFEENPPSLPDFIRRELRWCQGNMQYLRLLAMPGLKAVSRTQLALAVLMYVGAPAWMGLIGVGAYLAVAGATFSQIPVASGLAVLAAIMTFNLMPKIMGIGQILSDTALAERYGGRGRVLLGGVFEAFLSMAIAPIVAVAVTICMVGLVFGHRIRWNAQQRSREKLGIDEAFRSLWPQTLVGLALTAVLATAAPWAMIFAAPILFALTFSVPIAAVTTWPALSRLCCRTGLFDIPEDRAPVISSTPKVAQLKAA